MQHMRRGLCQSGHVLNHAGDLFTYAGMANNPAFKPDGAEYPVQWAGCGGECAGAWTDIGQVAGLPREAGVWPKELQRNDYFRRRAEHRGVIDCGGIFIYCWEL